MYTTILPIMEDLQEEFGDKREFLWANLYGYEPYKLVAFEDLTVSYLDRLIYATQIS